MKVSAKLNNFRKSPRKVRLVASLLKGLPTRDAENQLKFLIKGSAPNFEKLLKSAISNAENNFGLDKENLLIKDVVVNEGTKLKRWLPRAHGRASLLLKRTCSVEIILGEIVKGKGRKAVKKQEIKEVKGEKKVSEKEKKEVAKKSPVHEEEKEEKKELIKERDEKEFLDEKKKAVQKKGFLKKVFRRKSM